MKQPKYLNCSICGALMHPEISAETVTWRCLAPFHSCEITERTPAGITFVPRPRDVGEILKLINEAPVMNQWTVPPLEAHGQSGCASCDALRAEVAEQCRLLGMSGSREAALLARIAELEAALRECPDPHVSYPPSHEWLNWYDGTRARALGEGK